LLITLNARVSIHRTASADHAGSRTSRGRR
jgi:hypothetical protein